MAKELATRTALKIVVLERGGPRKTRDYFDNMDEPDYDRAERLMGISGKAGNLRGNKIEGGNIFEGPRGSEYPTPPMKMPHLAALFRGAAHALGYHPFPLPAATTSVPYTNPDGVVR